MENSKDILKYYKEELKWNPPFADVLSRYSPDALEGYFIIRKSVQDGDLPKKTIELIFTILDSLDDEVSGANRPSASSPLVYHDGIEAILHFAIEGPSNSVGR